MHTHTHARTDAHTHNTHNTHNTHTPTHAQHTHTYTHTHARTRNVLGSGNLTRKGKCYEQRGKEFIESLLKKIQTF